MEATSKMLLKSLMQIRQMKANALAQLKDPIQLHAMSDEMLMANQAAIASIELHEESDKAVQNEMKALVDAELSVRANA